MHATAGYYERKRPDIGAGQTKNTPFIIIKVCNPKTLYACIKHCEYQLVSGKIGHIAAAVIKVYTD